MYKIFQKENGVTRQNYVEGKGLYMDSDSDVLIPFTLRQHRGAFSIGLSLNDVTTFANLTVSLVAVVGGATVEEVLTLVKSDGTQCALIDDDEETYIFVPEIHDSIVDKVVTPLYYLKISPASTVDLYLEAIAVS